MRARHGDRDAVASIFLPLLRFFFDFEDGMNDAAITLVRRQHGEHSIDVHDIDPRALKIVRQLDEAGFEAFLVGGCLRDLLLGKQPKDFDIATNARPEEVAGSSSMRTCPASGWWRP